MKKAIIGLLLIVFITGCATQRFTINGDGDEKTEPDVKKMQHFFVAGIGQTKELNAAEICGGIDKVAKVEAYITFWDGLLGAVTWGIYTPHTAKVFCTD
ncbi:MAG: lipoprotein bor [Deltaproteobacteria bacterium]|nr:MAG: lipoprotein bor [Deltaproteobacteria bacterium]